MNGSNLNQVISDSTSPAPEEKPTAPATKHKLATAADFRSLIKDEDAFEPATYVTLPTSGLEVLLRRPRPIAYTLLGVPLPAISTFEPKGTAGLTPKFQPPADQEAPDTENSEQRANLARWTGALWGKVFVQPRLSMNPEADEIHPSWIPKEDKNFIWDWINGEVKYSGESLSTFPDGAQG
jgi:hypothetical protein